MRDKFILLWSAIIGATTLLLGSCEQSDSDVPMVDYGYVQFQLVKSLSEDMAPSSRASMLEWLADARKAEITMQSDRIIFRINQLDMEKIAMASAHFKGRFVVSAGNGKPHIAVRLKEVFRENQLRRCRHPLS